MLLGNWKLSSWQALFAGNIQSSIEKRKSKAETRNLIYKGRGKATLWFKWELSGITEKPCRVSHKDWVGSVPSSSLA